MESDSNQAPQIPAITLDPISSDATAALATHGSPDIRGTKLRKVRFTTKGRFHHATTLEADDLLALVASDPTHQPLLPPGAEPHAVTIDFQTTTSPRTTAELRPPHTITVQPESDTQVIVRWVNNSAFNAARKLG